MAVSESSVIQAVKDLTAFSIQTQAEAQAGQNLRANILYNSSTRLQGNFSAFYAEARRILAQDITRLGINPMDDDETAVAYAYLVADLQQKKNPDWNAQKVDYGGDAISHEPNRTSYKVAYDQFLDSLTAASLEPTGPELQPIDHENYPDSWKLSNLDDDPF